MLVNIRKFFLKSILTTFILLSINILAIQTIEARELSKAGDIFEQTKNGVVTIINAGHGSGFLVDEKGLILTNTHVINECDDDIRVRFGDNQIVQGKIIEKDRVSDIAVIQVNLKNINNYKVLPLFIPSSGEPLVKIGEKVIAIGSPIQWETLEKTLIQGIVGKYTNDIIEHDSAINGGNSGGPLLNYDGKVIGINTYVQSAYGQALTGAISIFKALSILERGKQKIKNAPPPPATLLPDIPHIAYPINEFLSRTNSFAQKKESDYRVKSNYYVLEFITPPRKYLKLIKAEKELMANRQKRAGEKGFKIDEDESITGNISQFYNYEKPVVTIIIKPVSKMKTSSKIYNAFMLTTSILSASTGSGYYAPSYLNIREYKKDFKKINLVNSMTNENFIPYLSSKLPLYNLDMNSQGLMFTKLYDKTYAGLYEYDYNYFTKNNFLKVVIETQGEQETIEIKIPDKVRIAIKQDFDIYENYIKTINPKNMELKLLNSNDLVSTNKDEAIKYWYAIDENKKNTINKLKEEIFSKIKPEIQTAEYKQFEKIDSIKTTANIFKYSSINNNFLMVKNNTIDLRFNLNGNLENIIIPVDSQTYPLKRAVYSYPEGKLMFFDILLSDKERFIFDLYGNYMGYSSVNKGYLINYPYLFNIEEYVKKDTTRSNQKI